MEKFEHSKGLVTGFVPGDLHAKIQLTDAAAIYFI